MRNLLNFLSRYNNLIIFLILEGLSFYLLATRNSYHNTRLEFGLRRLTNGIEKKVSNTRSYLSLREINKNIALENSVLKNRIEKLLQGESTSFSSVYDTVYNQRYTHTEAEVIGNATNRQKNFFTINKGLKQGIRVDMAVNSSSGIAGVIVGCSENFSVAMSLLNLDFKQSARIKSNGYFGSLSWDGRSYNEAILGEIPQHVNVAIGDTIETTGYSAIFPEGIVVGTVSSFEKTGGDFYRITVLLATDFRKLRFVDVVGDMKKTEQMQLQNSFQ